MSDNMTLIGRVRISKVTLKRKFLTLTGMHKELISEGKLAGWEPAYFRRTFDGYWERVSPLEYVRAIR